jgi:hypothetical protein
MSGVIDEILLKLIEESVYVRLNVIPKLKPHQLDFVKAYMVANVDTEYHEFYKRVNRLFILNPIEVINGVTYEYEKVFPKRKNVTVAQELMFFIFNKMNVRPGKV